VSSSSAWLDAAAEPKRTAYFTCGPRKIEMVVAPVVISVFSPVRGA
jgi:hypothetical protein